MNSPLLTSRVGYCCNPGQEPLTLCLEQYSSAAGTQCAELRGNPAFESAPGDRLRRAFRLTLLLSLFALMMSSVAYGQAITGSIVGTVKDPSGGAINGATVTITDSD